MRDFGRVHERLTGAELHRFAVERAHEVAAQKVDEAVVLVAVFRRADTGGIDHLEEQPFVAMET